MSKYRFNIIITLWALSFSQYAKATQSLNYTVTNQNETSLQNESFLIIGVKAFSKHLANIRDSLIRCNGKCHEFNRISKVRYEFESGEYLFNTPLNLIWDVPNVELEITAKSKSTVHFLGGIPVQLEPLNGLSELSEIADENQRSHIKSIDLSKYSVVAKFQHSGFLMQNLRPQLPWPFTLGKKFQLTRLPRRDYFNFISSKKENDITEITVKNFKYNDLKSVNTSNIFMFGYWAYPWADSYEKIEQFKLQQFPSKLKLTSRIKSHYGAKPTGGRMALINLSTGLKQDGDFYFDFIKNRIYIFKNDFNEKIYLATNNSSILNVDKSNNVKISKIRFAISRSNNITVSNSDNITFDYIISKFAGHNGLVVNEGRNVKIDHSLFHDIDLTAIILKGGDRKNLIPSNHSIQNSQLTRFSEWQRTYQPAIRIEGVGQKVLNNEIWDGPHQGIYYFGNDHEISFNNIHHVIQETSDSGAIYTGRDITFQGNKINNNFIHHLNKSFRGIKNHLGGQIGVYFDDLASGATVSDNFFLDIPYAIQIGGGSDFFVSNNYFVNISQENIKHDERGLYWTSSWIHGDGPDSLIYKIKNVDATSSIYEEKYPNLVSSIKDKTYLQYQRNQFLRNQDFSFNTHDINTVEDIIIFFSKRNIPFNKKKLLNIGPHDLLANKSPWTTDDMLSLLKFTN